MKRPQLMGILNLTPDSFSGAGAMDVPTALAQFEAMVEEGAGIIDLGAESTRPGATALTADAEWARLGPVLEALAGHKKRAQVKLSIDTYHPETAALALAAGIDILNDVSGLGSDAMLQKLDGGTQDVVVMHSLTLPVDPTITWDDRVDPVVEILRWKEAVTERAMRGGIAPSRLIYDPGLGFGKNARHSLGLLLRAGELTASGGRWLIGHSRKSFLRLVSDGQSAERDDLTLLASAVLVQAGVDMLRVHQVARHRQLLDALCS
jgi:dihydropteroate synthase